MVRSRCVAAGTRALRWFAVLAALAAAVAGCGGGVGVGGTGAFASGPISGFGSVIVNGIEFDDAGARVEDEDGATSSSAALRLGMVVEVDSGPIGGSASARTATATRIRYASELLGSVDAVDAAGGTLVVLGQTVQVSATTVFDERLASGLASVAEGSTLEVFGFYDAANERFTATRIEPRTLAPARFKVRGPVHDLDTAARRFMIGAGRFSYTSAPDGLADGVFVRVRVATTPVDGHWVVQSFGEGRRRLPDLDRAELRGLVTEFGSSTLFSVNGQPVDATNAAFPDGNAGLALGARVEVEGAVVDGVLHATEVEIDDDDDPLGRFELKGAVESHLPALQLFVLRGVTVFYGAPGLEFQDGDASDIAVGAEVEARGVLSADGTRLLATRIRFKD